jgi:penicillin amidase
MQEMQGDTYSLYGTIVVPAVLAAAQLATLTAEEQDVIDALAAWKFTCPTGLDESNPIADPATAPKATGAAATESIGCTAFHTVLFALVEEALGDEEAAAGQHLRGMPAVDLHLVVRALKDPTSVASGELLWDDVSTAGVTETRDEIILRALKDAASVLSKGVGPSDDWRWGRVHTLSLRSIFDSFGILKYNTPPAAAPGGQYTVNVGTPDNMTLPVDGSAPNFAFSFGPSIRFVIEAKAGGLTMSYELPGGEDLHRESPFYNNLLPNWLVNKPIEFPFGPGAVAKPASTTVVAPAP